MIILCDFDGTVVFNTLDVGIPLITAPNAVDVLKELVYSGHKIVLWTCRNNSYDNPNNSGRTEKTLQEAINWFYDNGVELFGINGYKGETEYVGTSRKLLGNVLIDDTAIGTPLLWEGFEYYNESTNKIENICTYCVDWLKVRQMLVSANIL